VPVGNGVEMNRNNDAARFFDSFASDFDTLYDGKRNSFMRWIDRKFRSDMFIRFSRTFEIFGNLTGKTVMDIGAGSGPYVLEAFKRGARAVTVIEPAANMLVLLKNRLEKNGFLERCRIVQANFPMEEEIDMHDYVIVMGVMDYVEDAELFLSTMRPLVRECAVISFPGLHWFRTPLRKIRYKIRKCPLYYRREEDILRLSNDAGFKSCDIYTIPGAGMDYHVVLRP
jgi:2-polyprenyl-3-methyl-5-hydroxy-6-metoxy-1,4-benzoquinol methylase